MDANFPAASVAAKTCAKSPIEWPIETKLALEAVLMHFPLGSYDPTVAAVQGIAVVDDPDGIPEVVAQAAPLLTAAGGFDTILAERHAFFRHS